VTIKNVVECKKVYKLVTIKTNDPKDFKGEGRNLSQVTIKGLDDPKKLRLKAGISPK
jgi:hypothetical protein